VGNKVPDDRGVKALRTQESYRIEHGRRMQMLCDKHQSGEAKPPNLPKT
jgi:hypothetical protein